MCSGSEAGSYLRLIDFMHHSTLGLRVIKKTKKFGGDPRPKVRRSKGSRRRFERKPPHCLNGSTKNAPKNSRSSCVSGAGLRFGALNHKPYTLKARELFSSFEKAPSHA